MPLFVLLDALIQSRGLDVFVVAIDVTFFFLPFITDT